MSYNLLTPLNLYAAMGMTGNLTSKAIEIKNQDNVGIQLTWTGNPTGVFGVEISSTHIEDSQGNVLAAGKWIPLNLSPGIIASGVADDAYIDLNQMSAQYARITYTRTGGAGALSAIVVAKGI